MRAIELIMKELADAVVEGKHGRSDVKGEDTQQPRRRSSRSQFRAEEGRPEAEIPQEGPAPVEQVPQQEPVASA
jgi:ribosomal protein S2